MSLLGWLGSTTKVNARSLSPIKSKAEAAKTERLVLGVLGTRSNSRCDDLDAHILAPLVASWRVPDEMILPAEGDSSYALQSWADMKGIPVRLVSCDWVTQGRRAAMMRDAQIQRDSSHLILLQGPRSTTLTALAGRLSRKGRPVLLSERPGLPATLISADKKDASK